MTFSFFLSIYSRCGAPASWAARHTTVCLDHIFIRMFSVIKLAHILYSHKDSRDISRDVSRKIRTGKVEATVLTVLAEAVGW